MIIKKRFIPLFFAIFYSFVVAGARMGRLSYKELPWSPIPAYTGWTLYQLKGAAPFYGILKCAGKENIKVALIYSSKEGVNVSDKDIYGTFVGYSQQPGPLSGAILVFKEKI